jgi:hypothetical protein
VRSHLIPAAIPPQAGKITFLNTIIHIIQMSPMHTTNKPNGHDVPAQQPEAGNTRNFSKGKPPMEDGVQDRYSVLQAALGGLDARQGELVRRMQRLHDMDGHAHAAAEHFSKGDFRACANALAGQRAILTELSRETFKVMPKLFARNALIPGAIVSLPTGAASVAVSVSHIVNSTPVIIGAIIGGGIVTAIWSAMRTIRQIDTASPCFLDSMASRINRRLDALMTERRGIMKEMREIGKPPELEKK